MRVPPGWFLPQWYLFFLGAVTSWVTAGRLSPGWLLALMAATVAATARHLSPEPYCGLAAAAAIWAVAKAGRLETLLGNAAVQFLGPTSYSLYLLHVLVGGTVLSIAWHTLGHSATADAVGVAVAIAASVAAAWALHVAVERPSVRLGRRVKMRAEYAAVVAARGRPAAVE